MSISVTYQSIHNWGEVIQRTSLFARLGAFFTFDGLSNRFASIAMKRVQEIHTTLHEAYSEILKDDSVLNGVTARELEECSKFISLLTKLHSIYSKVEFFHSSELKTLLEDTLQISYSIEAEIRIKAFKGKKRITTDQSYKEALSATSHNALHGNL
jgi:hypothetical protein